MAHDSRRGLIRVTLAEWVLMRQLYDEEALAPSRLAERMGMTRGAVSKLADRLIAKSLLVRTADPQDGRAQTLSLTRAGRAMLPKLAASADVNDAEFFDHLAPKERAALLLTLREIVEKRGLKSLPVD
jgi:DNA-binding MarR family transcriptional regulator